MYKDLRVICLVANLFCQTAVIFVGMCQDNASNIGKADAVLREFFTKRIVCLFRFRPYVNERERIFFN